MSILWPLLPKHREIETTTPGTVLDSDWDGFGQFYANGWDYNCSYQSDAGTVGIVGSSVGGTNYRSYVSFFNMPWATGDYFSEVRLNFFNMNKTGTFQGGWLMENDVPGLVPASAAEYTQWYRYNETYKTGWSGYTSLYYPTNEFWRGTPPFYLDGELKWNASFGWELNPIALPPEFGTTYGGGIVLNDTYTWYYSDNLAPIVNGWLNEISVNEEGHNFTFILWGGGSDTFHFGQYNTTYDGTQTVPQGTLAPYLTWTEL